VIDKLIGVRFTDRITKVYTKVSMNEIHDEDVAIDASGYTGKFHREKVDERKL
jgi:ArsR family metal-binding transcriptional regulator